MNSSLSRDEFLLLRDFIRGECGIDLAETKDYLVEARLRNLLHESGSRDFGDFTRKALKDDTPGLRERIIDAITTNETLWFRDNSCWETIRSLLWEELLLPGRSELSVWSAACSTGQEPYSLAIELAELRRQEPGRFSSITPRILASDISSSALEVARRGRYDRISINRGMSEPLRDRYFTAEGTVWQLRDEIRRQVNFLRFNLQSSFASLGRFDLILLRNVLIYFSPKLKAEIFRRLQTVLKPDGFLIVGASESVIQISGDFEMLPRGRGVCYRRKNKGNGARR